MVEIKCPNCGKVFQVDGAGYSEILRQVHTSEFEKELKKREMDYKQKEEIDIQIAESKIREEMSNKINELNEKLLTTQSNKDKEIQSLKNNLELETLNSKNAVENAIKEKELEITKLNSDIENNKNKYIIKENTLKEKHNLELKQKDDLIDYYKDMKIKMSTKMIGESLEQHCETEFNKLRATAFLNAEFGKDNDAKSGSKGDYIYREKSDDGIEFISIMFEMKNEMDTTATKHKNEDFFKELDKDRNEKQCEYAILVSMLESESENTLIYNIIFNGLKKQQTTILTNPNQKLFV